MNKLYKQEKRRKADGVGWLEVSQTLSGLILTKPCDQLKNFEAEMVGFGNRIAEYKQGCKKRKRRKPPFANRQFQPKKQ
jgi:hypothetical protein